MRKVKFAFWLILLGGLGLVFWQNQTFFLEKRGIEVDYFFGNYPFPELQIALYFLILFLAGLLISYFSSLSERFVARKTIRKLNDELTSIRKKNSDLEARLASCQAEESGSVRPSNDESADISQSTAT